MSDQPLFQNMDEEERIYAPEELPPGDPAAARVRAEEGALPARPDDRLRLPPSPTWATPRARRWPRPTSGMGMPMKRPARPTRSPVIRWVPTTTDAVVPRLE